MLSLKRVLTGVAACAAVLGSLANSSALADGPPIHQVRGNATWDLTPQEVINQININAWEDENGVHGDVVWASTYFGGPADNGWIFFIDVHTLIVDGNSAVVGGTIVFDNKSPEIFEGLDWYFVITDNGNGAADPPDELGAAAYGPENLTDVYPLLGGNLLVK